MHISDSYILRMNKSNNIDKIGRLTPIYELEPRKYPSKSVRMFRWVCDCGNEVDAPLQAVKSGNTLSCGCIRKEVAGSLNKTHGMSSKSMAYKTWKRMRRRCNNPSAKDAYIYSGVEVCKEWDDFLVFLNDMGEPPLGMSIDRIDNDLGYSKENCRWATPAMQAGNQRRNIMVNLDGESMCFSHACKALGVTRNEARVLARKIGYQGAIDEIKNDVAIRRGGGVAISRPDTWT